MGFLSSGHVSLGRCPEGNLAYLTSPSREVGQHLSNEECKKSFIVRTLEKTETVR